jgi:hypothetical protein
MVWTLLVLALGAPAVWAGTKAFSANCPIPCDDCPLAKR